MPWHLHRDASCCLQFVCVVVDVLPSSIWIDEHSSYYLFVGLTIFTDGLAVDDGVRLHEVRDF